MTAVAFKYPEEIQDIRKGIASFIKAEVIPRHEKHAALLSDQRQKYLPDGRYSEPVWELIGEIRRAAARAGYYGMCTPTEIGGGGFGYLAYFGAWEEIFRTCGMKYWLSHTIISHWAKGPSPVLKKVTPRAAKEIMPGLISGETTLCFALSEPEAGSDAAMIKTRADRDGDGWRLTGNKIWISNACHAEYAIVFAITDQELAAKRKGGISAFLVPTNSKGFVIESLIKMWGHPGTEECLLRFDNVRLEPHQLVGELHHGFDIAMLGVGFGRMYNSARAVGFSKWALEQAFDYVKVRKSYGKAIAEYQGVTFPLAQSAMEVHAAHLIALNTAQLLDAGERAHKELSICKAYAVQAGKNTLDRVMQVHGAMGFTNEMYFTEAYMSMRKVNVADGTNEILANVIAKRMLAGDIEL